MLSSASADATTLLVVTVTAANGATARRVVTWDGDRFARAGCARPNETVFSAGGEPWSAWSDGDDVVWGAWIAP